MNAVLCFDLKPVHFFKEHLMVLRADKAGIEWAAKALASGEVVAFPTETVFGLGGDALNDAAVKKIFELKGRPATNPLICHIAKVEDISQVADLAKLDGAQLSRFERLAEEFWPGPLTILLPKNQALPYSVTAGGELVGVRIPGHQVALDFISASGRPVAAPSANKYTKLSAVTARQVEEVFGRKLLVLDSEEPCHVGIESTVVNISTGINILRSGFVTADDIASVIGTEVNFGGAAASSSPGQHPVHYAPRTRLVIGPAEARLGDVSKSGLIRITGPVTPEDHSYFKFAQTLSDSGDLLEAAGKLYLTMHYMDGLGLDEIVVVPCAERGVGTAIMDRLRRAAAKG
jgi:L-threonylcarbamoyladenylate synthase